MKLLKLLFSRTMFVTLAILIQIGILYIAVAVLQEYFLIVRIANVVVAVLALISLINRDILPEGKLTWAMVIMILQFMGVVLYVMFSRNVLSKKQYRRLTRINIQSYVTMHNDTTRLSQHSKQMGQWYGVANYLAKASNVGIHTDTETLFLPTGELFWQELLEQLKKAKKYIFMEYFIIERGKMWDNILSILVDKVKQGVEVRVMYDDFGCITKLPNNYYKKLRKLGIKCVKFNRFRPIATAVHNNRDHRKITIIDGEVGFVGGANLADEYINYTHPFGYWKDTAVMLKGEAVKNLVLMFLQLYNMLSKQLDDFDEYVSKQCPEQHYNGTVIPFGDGPRPHYNEMVAEQTLLNLINQASSSLYITTPYLIPTYRLTKSLINAAKRGVDVNIITPGIPDKKLIYLITRYNYWQLMKAGVKIHEYTPGFIHSKTIIADGVIAVVGTINMDYRSLVHHYECGVLMYNTKAVGQVAEDIKLTISKSKRVNSTMLKWRHRVLCKLLMLFTPLL